jgi:hypothetical protein
MLSIILSLIWEPLSSLRAALSCIFGKKPSFNFYNLNPTKLRSRQLTRTPILLLHGNYHNQSAWLSLAKKLKKFHFAGALFTVTLPNGPVTQKDYEIIYKKILEIKHLYNFYGVAIKELHLIGHSRGAFIADSLLHSDFLQDLLPDALKETLQEITLGKVVKLGYARQKIDVDPKNNEFEITGVNDKIFPEKSLLPPTQCRDISCGHLGLIYAKRCHQLIIVWLRPHLDA